MHWILGHLDKAVFRISGTTVTLLTLVVALAIVVVTLVLARFARKGVEAWFRRGKHDTAGVGYSVARIVQYLIILGGLFIALNTLGVRLTALAAVGAILGVGIGFGLQNIAQNFVSGVILLVERPVRKGDFVVVGDTVGTVQEISMRATRVVSRDGVSIIVPNSELVSNRVLNQSQPTATYRVRIGVGVAYGSDVELVRSTLLDVANAHPAVLHTPPPTVFFRNFGDSSLDFELAVWLDDPQPEPAVTSDLRFAIDGTFREREINIPFPQRDLHIIDGLEMLRRGGKAEAKRAQAPAPMGEAPHAQPVVRDTTADEKAAHEHVTHEMEVAAREQAEAERKPSKRAREEAAREAEEEGEAGPEKRAEREAAHEGEDGADPKSDP